MTSWNRFSCLSVLFALAAAVMALFVLSSCGGGAGPAAGVPEEVLRHNNRGTSYLSQQKWAEAAEQFRQGLALRPDDPVLLTNVAVALMQQGKPDEAATWLERAVAADPAFPQAHFNLGLIRKNSGDFEAAAEHFAEVAATDPDEVFTQYSLGSSLARVGRTAEAEAALRRALERNPMHVSSLYSLGRLLLQEGQADEGAALIARSQEIRAQGLDEAVGTQYGEQGPYAMGVDYPASGLAAPDAVPVTFELRSVAEDEPATASWAHAVLPGGDGGAPALLVRGAQLRRIDAGGAAAAGPAGGALAIAAGDLDGDGRLELVELGASRSGRSSLDVRALDAAADGSWSRRESPLVALRGAPGAPSGGALALVDRDHDGDLDLFGCWTFDPEPAPPRCVLADNDGSGKFAAAPEGHGVTIAGPAPRIRAGFSDIDNDRDVDLLVATGERLSLFFNDRDGTFSDVSDARGLGAAVRGAESLAIADLDKDGFMDLVVGTAAGPQVLWNRRGTFEAPASLEALAGGAGAAPGGSGGGRAGAVALDFDNDGFLDVAATDAAGSFALYRNLGAGGWTRVATPLAADAGPLTPLAAFDADADGDLDLAVRAQAAHGLLINQGGNANRWLSIRPTGVGDNDYAIGLKVEVLAGGLRQKFEVTTPLPVHAGLGSRERADAVRMLWPGGVLQDELDQQAGSVASIEQLDRKGTSCPLLYAWRDGGWRFVTDFLGGCAIGYQHAPGVFSTPDTDEYVKVEGGLVEQDGLLRLRLNNQLEEVIWFDQAELVVVEHPAGSEVFPNERLMPGPPWPEFRLFASHDVRPLRGARDPGSDRDVTGLLERRDRRWVEGFGLLPFKGYAEPHALELDLGDLPAGRRVVLLLDGWIDYADSSANVAAHQAGVALEPPRLSTGDGHGGWRETRGLMGFPAGLPKTMAVDLTGRLRAADPRVRIETNMRIYWDRARVMVGGEDTPLRVTRVPASTAELRFGGFPQETSPDGRKPFDYDPARVEPRAPWKAHVGRYTAFGDVRELLRAVDDRFVTTRSGDELELAFESPGPPQPGWTRTYLLYADGFGKDMDPNSAANDRVGPIPFHGMPTYPYGPGVVPPVAADGEAPARRVLPAPDGLHGATPLALR